MFVLHFLMEVLSMERMVKSFDGVGLYSKTEIPAGAKAIAVIVHGLAF